MRACVRLAVRLYPSAWRTRYGEEFEALLEDRVRSWEDVADIALGGIGMRLRYTSVPAMAALLGVAAAVAAGAAAAQQPDRFEWTALLEVHADEASDDPREHPQMLLDTLRSGLSAGSLTPLVVRYGLHGSPGVPQVSEELLRQVRGHVRVQPVLNENVFRISLVDTDAQSGRRITEHLTRELTRATQALPVRLHAGQRASVEGQHKNADRVSTAGTLGFGGGALAGALFGFARRRFRRT
jgi:hypothetical protein